MTQEIKFGSGFLLADDDGTLHTTGSGGGGGGGDASAANQTTEIAKLTSIDGKTPSLGQAAAGSSSPVVFTTAEEALLGSSTETTPGTDTASSGLNGRLQRIAQRLTSLIALLPTSLGTKTSANSLAVVVASDQAAYPISQGAGASAGTAWRIQGDFVEQSGLSAGSLNADLVPSTDVSAYKQWSLQITAIGNAANVLTFQGSNDNSNWISIPGLVATAVGNATPVIQTSTATLYRGEVFFRFLRVRMTSYTSGTATGVLELRTQAAPAFTSPMSVNGTATTAGNKTNNNAVPGATNVGALVALANAANPSWTEGNEVLASVDLSGNQRVAPTPYPSAATPETASSGNQANANAVATLAASSGKTTYITGFEITATGATSAGVVTVTVAGVITGTMSYTFAVPAGVSVGCTPLIVEFPYPIPASATNTTIVVTLPALGSGNTNATTVAHGFQL